MEDGPYCSLNKESESQLTPAKKEHIWKHISFKIIQKAVATHFRLVEECCGHQGEKDVARQSQASRQRSPGRGNQLRWSQRELNEAVQWVETSQKSGTHGTSQPFP